MKKIIAVIAALMFAAVLFNINVSAMSKNEYQTRYFDFVGCLERGEMTYEEFEKEVNSLTSEYCDSNTDSNGVIDSVAENVSNTVKTVTTGIGNAISKTGNAVNEIISDIFNDYETTETVPTTDMKGYGCKIIHTNSDGSYYVFYSEYAEIYDNGRVNVYNDTVRELYNNKGVFVCIAATSTNGMSFTDYDNCTYYGDVRYPGGTQAPTDDEYVEQPTYDFSNATDSELDELLKELMEELKRQTPDLSSLEGLLESIYYRLGELDKDDDNALLSDINFAILALMESNNANNEELVNALFEIRDDLKGESDDEEEGGTSDEESGETTESDHPNHICGTLYNVKPLDKNWLTKLFTDVTELRVEYQGETYYLEECGCLKLSSDGVLGTELGAVDKYYSVDMNYDSYTLIDYDFSNEDIYIDNSKYVDIDFKNYTAMWGNLSKTQQNKINDIVSLLYKMIEQSVPYAMVTSTLQAFQLVVFNTATPEDIVLSFDATEINGAIVGGFEVTVLSTEFFSNDKVASAMKVVKSFLTVVIGYAWLLSMRKQVTGMLR